MTSHSQFVHNYFEVIYWILCGFIWYLNGIYWDFLKVKGGFKHIFSFLWREKNIYKTPINSPQLTCLSAITTTNIATYQLPTYLSPTYPPIIISYCQHPSISIAPSTPLLLLLSTLLYYITFPIHPSLLPILPLLYHTSISLSIHSIYN